MKITCLVENTRTDKVLAHRHGLSLFIETDENHILFDFGPDDTLIRNAGHLGIDLSRTDTAVLSHGHLDHGGGIPAFQKICPEVKIHMAEEAVGQFSARMLRVVSRNIGLDPSAMDHSRLSFVNTDLCISRHLTLFKDFDQEGFCPKGNRVLFRTDQANRQVPDDFSHELALLIQEGPTHVLITGCSHSGISNMIRTVLRRTGLDRIDTVIGGFHLFTPLTRQTESEAQMATLVAELSEFKETRFYTGHCTGQKAFSYLRKQMGERIQALSTGTVIRV